MKVKKKEGRKLKYRNIYSGLNMVMVILVGLKYHIHSLASVVEVNKRINLFVNPT